MILWAMPPVLPPVAWGVRLAAFIPVPRAVPPAPVLPVNRPAAFLIMLPKFM